MTKKILMIIDSKGWAIDQLSQVIIKNNPQFEIMPYYFHPRDVDREIEGFKKAVKEFKPDIIHTQYFRSYQEIYKAWNEIANYTNILTHHNQRTKALFAEDWNKIGIDCLVTHTKKCKEMLESKGQTNIKVIQHGIDLNYFEYNGEEPEDVRVGYVGRIVPWKRLGGICEACKQIGEKVLVMGKEDKADYWLEIQKYAKEGIIDFSYFNCKNDERKDAYNDMTIFINNSIDGYEEGPLPLLEAMACGVPVITTPTGEGKDICEDQENCLMVDCDNVEMLKAKIKLLLNDKELRNKLRKNAWNTLKNLTCEKMAYEYSNLFYKTGSKDDLVSVVIPVYNNKKQLDEILKALENQTYKNIEAVICDDGGEDLNDNDIKKYRTLFSFPIKYINTIENGSNPNRYNLAMARNLGVIESDGKYIMFNDARLCPQPDAIRKFLDIYNAKLNKIWLFGNKGTGKKSFVENFSFIKRSSFINFGMLNERINNYGGMSQEIRSRWSSQKGEFLLVEGAIAKELKTSKNTTKRRNQIVKMKFLLYKMYNKNNN